MAINLRDIQIQTAIIIIGGTRNFIYTLQRSWGGRFDHICQSFHDCGQSVAGRVRQGVTAVWGDSVSHRNHVLVVVGIVSLTDHVLDGCGGESEGEQKR